MTSSDAQSSPRFSHDALVYRSGTEYVRTLAPIIDAALAAGDAVYAVVPPANETLLRDALGDAAGRVEVFDAGGWYRHPHQAIAHLDRLLRGLRGARSLVVNEVEFGTTAQTWVGWTRYDAALNRALMHHNVRVVCPYDARTLPAAVLELACTTHPHVLQGDARRASAEYVAPEDLMARLAASHAVPDHRPEVDLQVGHELRAARSAFADVARIAGFAEERIADLTLGVSEVLTNAVVHGDGSAHLRVWCRAGDLTCLVEDRGPGVKDPLLGYVPPALGSMGGYGLWIACQVFDRSDLTETDGGGLTVMLSAQI